MSSCNCPPLAKSTSAFGALQTVSDRRYSWAGSRQRAVPTGVSQYSSWSQLWLAQCSRPPPTSAQVTHLEITRLNSTRMLLSPAYGT